ncbi:translation initiation factor eIF3 subunit g [Entophlyctis luteolus]|nr:translation initiation factor eIF3 subunit g [Entophlyctis luteolus]
MAQVKWGDHVEDDDDEGTLIWGCFHNLVSNPTAFPELDAFAPRTIDNGDGTKTVVTFRINDDGKRVKSTSIVRTKVVKSKVNPEIARRRTLRKFGDCVGLKPGPDTDSTSFGEKVALKLSASAKSADLDAPDLEEVKKKAALASAKIMCRICKGDHFTAKCPFKDSHQPLLSSGAVDGYGAETLAGVSRGGGRDSPAATTVSTSGKYVPPGMRGNATGGARLGSSMGGPGIGSGDYDDLPTVRVANLSEDTTDDDFRDLVGRFGHTQRVFLARDRFENICKGFGYVTYYDKFAADKCIAALNGYGYDNLILSAELAKNKPRT